MSEFDSLSSNYKNILDKDLQISGESSEYFASYKAMCVHRHMGDNFSGSILDYGCGVGAVSEALRRCYTSKKVDISGYDTSPKSIEVARGNVKDVDFKDDYRQIEDRKFDVIVMANVMHHVKAADRHEFLKRSVGRLAGGGKFFIFEHNPYNPLTRYVVKRSVIDRGVELIKLKDMEILLRKVDVLPVEKRYIVFFPKILKALRPFEAILGGFPIGAQYVFVGKAA